MGVFGLEDSSSRLLMSSTMWLSGTESAWQRMRHRFHPCVRKIPWRRKWQPTPVFLPMGLQKSLTWLSDWTTISTYQSCFSTRWVSQRSAKDRCLSSLPETSKEIQKLGSWPKVTLHGNTGQQLEDRAASGEHGGQPRTFVCLWNRIHRKSGAKKIPDTHQLGQKAEPSTMGWIRVN